MKLITLTPDTEHLRFDEIAHLFADALWPARGPDDERIAYGACRLQIEEELKMAVRAGSLDVLNPLTRGPHTLPVGDALKRALVRISDVEREANARGIEFDFDYPEDHDPYGGLYWRMEAAVAKIANNVRDVSATSLLKKAKLAAAAGTLRGFDPATRSPAPVPDHDLSDLIGWYRSADINAWLDADGFDFDFRLPPRQIDAVTQQSSSAPLQRSAAQEAAILGGIRALGFEPNALPKNKSGKRGIKSAVREQCRGNPLFVGSTVFDKAWDRMRAERVISDSA